MLAASVVKRILLAKYLYSLAVENGLSHREVSAFAAANLLQDAVEVFLFASVEHLNAKVDRRTEFAQFIDKIDEKIAPKVLPFRVRLLQLNKIRVASKHDGIKPDYKELESIIVVAREFFEEASRSIFETEFSAINLVSQLEEGEPRNFLEQSEKYFHQEKFVDALVSARKALFLVFEKNYDVSKFASGERQNLLLNFCSAPIYAQNKKYIDDNVRTPFDYIIIDHSRLDSDLLKDGINPTDFWNVWRLTPEVYCDEDGEWLINDQLNKTDNIDIERNAAYVIETAIDIVLRFQSRRKSARWAGQTYYIATLKNRSVKVYKKADLASEVIGITPPELDKINVESLSIGLRRAQGRFWSMSHFEKGLFLIGFVHETDVDNFYRM